LISSPLPKLVHAHARHILSNSTPARRPIDLLSHQLIASKMVRYLSCLIAVSNDRETYSLSSPVRHQSSRSVKTGYLEQQKVGRFGARTVKSMSGYRVLLVYLIKDGTNSEPPSRVSVIFLMVHTELRHLAQHASTSSRQVTTHTSDRNDTRSANSSSSTRRNLWYVSPRGTNFWVAHSFQASNENLP
jgi:hypothetical protein